MQFNRHMLERVLSSKIVLEALDYVRRVMENYRPGHGFDHVLRVLGLGFRIASMVKNSVDFEVLALASIFHDVGRVFEERKKIHHAIISARIAREFLESRGYPKSKIEAVINAILSHSFSLGFKPRSIEGKILSDADKLDAIGAIGIARCFMDSAYRGRSIKDSVKHFYNKLLNLKDLLYTEPARRIAERRHRFLIRFLEELKQDLSECEIKCFQSV